MTKYREAIGIRFLCFYTLEGKERGLSGERRGKPGIKAATDVVD